MCGKYSKSSFWHSFKEETTEWVPGHEGMYGQPHRTDPEAERGNVVVKGQPAIHDIDIQELLKNQKGK